MNGRTTQAGWNSDAIFACDNCAGKLANWEREKAMAKREAKREMEGLCPCLLQCRARRIGLHEGFVSSGAALVASSGCPKGRQTGASGGNQLRPIRGMKMMESWVTSLKRWALSFMSRLRSTSLCGVKAPDRWLSEMDMDYADGVAALWPMRRLFASFAPTQPA